MCIHWHTCHSFKRKSPKYIHAIIQWELLNLLSYPPFLYLLLLWLIQKEADVFSCGVSQYESFLNYHTYTTNSESNAKWQLNTEEKMYLL